VRRNVLVADGAIAVALAILVLIVSPGLAVVAMIALFVLVVCGVSLVLELARASRRERAGRRRRR
jgi:ABC-type bacteriocin/lantibiotic exporter with double-glycine peptidase domain